MPEKTSPSTRKLSEVARHVCYPKSAVTTAWGKVEPKLKAMGIVFDEWQRGIAMIALAKDADGSYSAGTNGVGISIPRQVGKTFLVGWLVFALCLIFPKVTVVWTAHRTRTADETFASMSSMAEQKKVKPHVRKVFNANGNKSIIFKNGSRILFGARESGFGRGFAKVDILVFDEAQILTENAMSDMVPSTNASPNALVFLMGTPPRPKDPGEVFRNIRSEALAGNGKATYVELSADPDTDPSKWKPGYIDWKQVAKANPSFPHRTNRKAIERMFNLLGSIEGFKREGLGIWDEVATAISAIPAKAWKACKDVSVSPGPYRSFAVRFSVDGSHVALAAASKVDRKRVLVEGVRVEASSEGLDWVIDFLTDPDRLASTQQIVVEGKSGADFLVNCLRGAGIPSKVLITPGVSQVVAAHSMFLESVKEKTLVHRGDEDLTREAHWAQSRKIGNLGGFGWKPPEGQSVALLDAATMALWAAKTSKRRPKGGKGPGVVIL